MAVRVQRCRFRLFRLLLEFLLSLALSPHHLTPVLGGALVRERAMTVSRYRSLTTCAPPVEVALLCEQIIPKGGH